MVSGCSGRRERHRLLPLTVQSAGYLMLITSLPPSVTAAEVLAAYRLRWQGEMAWLQMTNSA